MPGGGTLLYYAMGGGLGHVTRAIAILREMGRSPFSQRILASGRHAHLAAKESPAPLDIVSGGMLDSWGEYSRFLESYIREHRIRAVVLDTFPWGIAGEWSFIAPRLPRFLIARALKWDDYLAAVGSVDGPAPAHVLAIEEPEPGYRELLLRHGTVENLEEPILLRCAPAAAGEKTGRWLIVHSGDGDEREALLLHAAKKMEALGVPGSPVDRIFPERGIYPVQPLVERYSHVVSAAGYNMAALASQAPAGRSHHLVPFPRRFDDQAARLRRIGSWEGRGAGTPRAARWLREKAAQFF